MKKWPERSRGIHLFYHTANERPVSRVTAGTIVMKAWGGGRERGSLAGLTEALGLVRTVEGCCGREAGWSL